MPAARSIMVAVYLRLSPPPGLLINRIVTAICTDSPMRKSLKSTSPRSIETMCRPATRAKCSAIELKPSYWRTAVENMTELEAEMDAPTLFDEVAG